MNLSECSTCKKPFLKLLKCGGCKNITYCSQECQKLDWPKHKLTCKPTITKEVKVQNSKLDFPKVDPRVKKFLEEKTGHIRDKKTGCLLTPHFADHMYTFIETLNLNYYKEYNVNPKVIKLVDQDLDYLPDLLNIIFDKTYETEEMEHYFYQSEQKILQILFTKSKEELDKYQENLIDFFYKIFTNPNKDVEAIVQPFMRTYRKKKISKVLHIYILEAWKRASTIGIYLDGAWADSFTKEGIDLLKLYMIEELKDPIWRFPTSIASTICILCDLKAVEYLDLIKDCFEKNCVNISIFGGYKDALIKLGVDYDPGDPLIIRYERVELERRKECEKFGDRLTKMFNEYIYQ